MSRRHQFSGHIAGVGSSSGVRVVVGRWHTSPYGTFADAMVADATGRRVLLAPTREVADFVAATYTFDEVRVEGLTVAGDAVSWRLRSPSLTLDLTRGRRTALGRLLRLVPPAVARSPWWCAVTDPVARLVLRGVRTRGVTGPATARRREWYGALDHHRVVAAAGTWEGADLGALAPVSPPPAFGFSSTPPRPSVTTVVTTVEP